MSDTKEKLLDIAERSVLTKGFDATSIEEIVAEAGISKGGFFYHFPDKNTLARALLERSIALEDAMFNQLEERARELTDDPLQFILVSLKLFAEVIASDERPYYGSLVSVIVYQERLFDSEVVKLNRDSLQGWEDRWLMILEYTASLYEMADNVSLSDVAGMFNTIVEGGIIHAKAMDRPEARAKQVLVYRSYLKMLFHKRKGE